MFISHSLIILPNIRTLSYKQLYHINPLVCLLFLMKNDQVTKLHIDSRLNNTDQDPISLILKKQPFTLKKHVGEICHGPPMCYMTMVQGKYADLDVMSHTKINEWHTLWPFILHTNKHKDPLTRPFWMNIFNKVRGILQFGVKPPAYIFSQKVFSLNMGQNYVKIIIITTGNIYKLNWDGFKLISFTNYEGFKT